MASKCIYLRKWVVSYLHTLEVLLGLESQSKIKWYAILLKEIYKKKYCFIEFHCFKVNKYLILIKLKPTAYLYFSKTHIKVLEWFCGIKFNCTSNSVLSKQHAQTS